MSKVHGKNASVLLSTTGTGAAAAIKVSGWTLDQTVDFVEVTSFGDPNKTYVAGLKDVSGTITGFWDDADDALYDAMNSRDGCKLYLYGSSGIYWYGPAVIDFSINVDVAGAITTTSNFRANGAWGHV